MGRTRPNKSRPANKSHKSTSQPPPTVEQLLVQSASFIAAQDYDSAKQACQRAVGLAQEGGQEGNKMLGDAWEILGTVELELGELDEARQHFLSSVQISSTLPDPSPAPYLYLAQLSSPLESLQHFGKALEIIQAKLASIELNKSSSSTPKVPVAKEDQEDEFDEEAELRRSASRALVGMTELYLTDLCFEADAENKCEEHLALAAQIDPTDPEVFQTLASVRLSQQRPSDALSAATQGWSLWRSLGPESAHYPPSSSRLGLAKVLLELSRHEDALEILQRLEMEDDEDPEVWYLSGWAWWLLGEVRGKESGGEGQAEEEEAKETKAECWSEARLCLENYMRLDERDSSGSDPEQLAHVKELLGKLDEAGIVASAGQEEEGADEWQDEEEEDDDGDDAMEE